ncbi:MAG: hypothetical protein IKV59_02740 [Lachnospiraceae bacterium]|nr:hypothetical protein [Lachnospiraceae bacterium]
MKRLVIVRGGGDIATGTIYKLYQCGFQVLVLETAAPSAIRRNVSFSEAVYQGEQTVENVTCILAKDTDQAVSLLNEGKLVMLKEDVIPVIAVCVRYGLMKNRYCPVRLLRREPMERE